VPAANTERAYRADAAHFAAWCATQHRRPQPATVDTLVAYVRALATEHAPATVRRRLAGIAATHRAAGLDSPIDDRVRLAVASVAWKHRRRRRDTEPLDVASLRRLSAALPVTRAGARDRAILLLGYGAALRRTELVHLDVANVQVVPDVGLAIALPRGRIVVPPGSVPLTCAVRAWTAWLRASGLEDGPAFRPVDRHDNVRPLRLSDRAVTLVVQRAAARAGLDATRYTGRSLRRGMILAAAAVGASDAGIMAQTGHRSRRLVRAYRQVGYVPAP
jgi:site-specific recombinase XerD